MQKIKSIVKESDFYNFCYKFFLYIFYNQYMAEARFANIDN